jgi:hypothetical protein
VSCKKKAGGCGGVAARECNGCDAGGCLKPMRQAEVSTPGKSMEGQRMI